MKQNKVLIISPSVEAVSAYEETTSYKIGKMTFMINRVFQKDGDSVGAILVRLMTSESNLLKECP